MKIFGKTLSEYAGFEKVVLWLIAIVGIARLALSLAGVPNSAARWVSVTAVSFLGLVYISIKTHTAGFGSYKQLLPLVWIQAVLAHFIVIAGIVLAIETGRDNIFSAPEFSGGGDGKTWTHVLAHVIAGFVFIPILGWIIGSVILLVTKKVAPRNTEAA